VPDIHCYIHYSLYNLGFIVRVDGHNERVVDTTLMVSTNEDCTETRAVLRVLKADQMALISQRILDLKSSIWHPCILASLQVESRLLGIRDHLLDRKKDVERMEMAAGIYEAYHYGHGDTRNEDMLQRVNSAQVDLLRIELASMKNRLVYQKYKCNMLADLLQFLDEMASKLPPSAWSTKSRHLRSTINGYKARTQYLCDRTETTMQTVGSPTRYQDVIIGSQPIVLLPHGPKGQFPQSTHRRPIP